MFPLLVLCSILFACGSFSSAAATPCYASFDNTTILETPCFDLLSSNGAGLEVRNYSSGEDVSLVSYNISNSGSMIYQEALTEGGYYVICYFLGECNTRNESILSSRTVPFILRTPSEMRDYYIADMALAPSKWPPFKKAPTPSYGIVIAPLGNVLLASLHAQFDYVPQPLDFNATCDALVKSLPQLDGGKYVIDTASPISFSHARYFGWLDEGPFFDFECWAGVKTK